MVWFWVWVWVENPPYPFFDWALYLLLFCVAKIGWLEENWPTVRLFNRPWDTVLWYYMYVRISERAVEVACAHHRYVRYSMYVQTICFCFCASSMFCWWAGGLAELVGSDYITLTLHLRFPVALAFTPGSFELLPLARLRLHCDGMNSVLPLLPLLLLLLLLCVLTSVVIARL